MPRSKVLEEDEEPSTRDGKGEEDDDDCTRQGDGRGECLAFVGLGDQFIANAGDGFDFDTGTRQFFAKMGNVDIYVSGFACKVIAPGEFEQLFCEENDAGVLDKHRKEVEFLGAQRNSARADMHLAAIHVEGQIPERNAVVFCGWVGHGGGWP